MRPEPQQELASTRLRIGSSQRADPREAAAEAVSRALKDCATPALALAFSTFDYAMGPLAAALGDALGTTPWAGCSSPAVVDRGQVLKQGLVVGVLDSPAIRVGIGDGGHLARNPREAGRTAVSAALSGLPATHPRRSRAVVLLADAVVGNNAEVIRGAVEIGGAGLVWVGGGTGDPLGQRTSAQLASGKAHQGHVIAVAIDCPAPLGSGIAHGWHPYGPPSLVTSSAGSVVHALEYERAFDVYRRAASVYGEDVSGESFTRFAMTHPLGIPQANGDYLIRDPVAFEEDGSLRCVGELPDGALVRVMQGTPDELVRTGAVAVEGARAQVAGPLAGALTFDCVSRSLLLGDRVAEGLALAQRALGEAPLFGCLSFGEVGSFGVQIPQLHNKTTVVLAIPA